MQLLGKTILITGANGLVGVPTIEKCIQRGAKKVIAVDINCDNLKSLLSKYPNLVYIKTDLRYLAACESLFQTDKVDIVLHIAGIKGSPTRTASSPADYLIPMLQFNTNIMDAAFKARVDWFVYLSSVGVYAPAEVMEEESVWHTMPSKNDWHPGWAKRMGELTLDSLRIQHDWKNWTVIRPSNIYGCNDNFKPDATVVAANVWKLFNTDSEMVCWGDGSARRDFIFAEDVAEATIAAVENEVNDVVNCGCGKAVTIKETIETLVDVYKEITGKNKTVVWDTTKPNGDLLRCLSSVKQERYSMLPKTTLRDGLLKTVNSYMNKYIDNQEGKNG